MTSAISIREVRANTETDNFWTASQTAATSVIAADATRVGVLVVNNTTGRVYFRFDTTAPTSASNGHHWFLESKERWEVPEHLTSVVWSVVAEIASGHVVFHLATVA